MNGKQNSRSPRRAQTGRKAKLRPVVGPGTEAVSGSPTRGSGRRGLKSAVRLAAQADLLLLTCEMLKPPPRRAMEFHSCPPETNGPVRSDWLERPAWTALTAVDLEHLLNAAGLPERTATDGPTLAFALDEAVDAGRQTPLPDWFDEYWRLFDTDQACPIHEASWVRRDKGAILGDLAGFYRAFGWTHDAARGTRPDHLLCELEYTAALLAMASQAATREQRQVVAAAVEEFAREHLHDWLPSFCWQLCEVTRVPYFGALAAWLMMLWDGLTAVHGWPADVGPGRRLLPGVEEENPYECAAAGVVQLGHH